MATDYTIAVCPFCREQLREEWGGGFTGHFHDEIGSYVEPVEVAWGENFATAIETARAQNVTRWERARLDKDLADAEAAIANRRHLEYFDSLTAEQQLEEFGYTADMSWSEKANGMLKKTYAKPLSEELSSGSSFLARLRG
jgi:hypothetical protein